MEKSISNSTNPISNQLNKLGFKVPESCSSTNDQKIKSVRSVKFRAEDESTNADKYEPISNHSNSPAWKNEKEEKIYIPKIFADVGFPKRPIYKEAEILPNGDDRVKMSSSVGLPYGHDKDLILYVSNLAYQSKEKELYFSSKAELIRELDKVPHSDTCKRLMESLFRLLNTEFIYYENRKGKEKDPFQFKIFESINPTKQSITLTLTDEFFHHVTKIKLKTNEKKETIKSPTNLRPFDKRLIKELKNSKTALDTLTFIANRARHGEARMNILEFMDQIKTSVKTAKQFYKSFSKKITSKLEDAYKKVYNCTLPKGLFSFFTSGKGRRKSFTLVIRGNCQILPKPSSS